MPSETLVDPVRAKQRPRRNNDVRRAAADPFPARRERPGSADPYADADTREYLRQQGRGRRVRRGLIPQSRFGRIAAGTGLLLFLGGMAAVSYFTLRFLHHDPQFTVPSSAAIEMAGNQHLTRSQLLSVFGGDVDRNIFAIPLEERQDELEQIPWVENATVMRLLPNRIRVQVTERAPIAFVRQGGTIGMVDASGVLLDIPPDAPGNPNYSFPVVTGLKADDTPASREQRMRLYAAFLKDMDSGGKKLSSELSEVDLSDPEDVKVLLPSGNAETLVHFGTGNFLARYNRFEEHIAEWRQQYPRLNSVDMRYERQVVLQMPPKDSTVQPGTEVKTAAAANGAKVRSEATTVKTAPVAALKGPAVPAPSAGTLSAVHHAPPHADVHPAKAKPADKTGAKQADMAKRVEAIKAWMARRQEARNAAKSRAAAQ